MGYYIEVPRRFNKATQLANMYGALPTLKPQSFKEVPEGIECPFCGELGFVEISNHIPFSSWESLRAGK